MRKLVGLFFSFSLLCAAQGYIPEGGGGGGTGPQGPAGPTGSIGNLITKTSTYPITCADILGNQNFDAGSNPTTFTFPTGCTAGSGWFSITPGTGFPAVMDLATNSVTVNGQSTFGTLAAGSGTTGYTRAVCTPVTTTNFRCNTYQSTGSGTPGGSSGQVQYNNSGAFGGFTTSGDATINTATGALTLGTVNTNTGACGDSTHVCQVTLNGKGLATAATAVAIASASQIVTQSGVASATTASTTEVNLLTASAATAVKIPAGTLSANGSVSVYLLYQSTGSTSTRFPIIRVSTTQGGIAASGGFTLYNASMSAGQFSYANVLTFYNSGATNTQIMSALAGSGNQTTTTQTGAIDTAANDIWVNFNGLVTSGSDTIRVMAYKVVVNP